MLIVLILRILIKLELYWRFLLKILLLRLVIVILLLLDWAQMIFIITVSVASVRALFELKVGMLIWIIFLVSILLHRWEDHLSISNINHLQLK